MDINNKLLKYIVWVLHALLKALKPPSRKKPGHPPTVKNGFEKFMQEFAERNAVAHHIETSKEPPI